MQIDYALLQALHAKLNLIADLNDQLDRCPRMIRAAEAAERNLLQEYDSAKKLLVETRKAADEKQMQLSSREARIEKMSGQRNAAENNREFQVLGEQIEADLLANAVLSDEILELLERIDVLTEQQATTKSNHAKGIAEAERVRGETASRVARIENDLLAERDELAKLERQLPGQVMEEYRRLVKASGENALAETDGETCGGCHSVLTTQTMSDLFSKKPVYCKNCGTFLYVIRGQAV